MKNYTSLLFIPTSVFFSVILLFQGNLYSFDYGLYNRLLNRHVKTGSSIAGVRLNTVDYGGLIREKGDPSSDYSRLLKQLSGFDPSHLSGREEKIAFWINVYNIAAIKMILDNYPVDSIRSFKISIFKNPWNKKIITIGGKSYSLHEIEHGILLGRFRKLRAHFAIVCASVSCPDLAASAYTGKNLNNRLQQQAVTFFKNKRKGLRIDRDRNVVSVSRIFKFDKKNFPRGKVDIIPFILPFLTNDIDINYLKNENYVIDFLPYDWDLNKS